MEFVRLRSPQDERFCQAMELYRQSFPRHEQREELSQKAILSEDEYHFDLVYDGDRFVGLLLSWQSGEFIYVEHFCIRPELRGQKYGQRALELLGQKGKTVILEIDPPVDGISTRRKAFYERCGYQANGFAHVHPPYRPGSEGHPLVVLSAPGPLSDETYGAFAAYLKHRVMGA